MALRTIIIATLGAGILVGAWFFTKGELPPSEELLFTATTTPTSLATSSSAIPAHWKKYQNAHYGIALHHPPNLTIKEFNEGGGAMTITFQDPAAGEGLQLFVTPYTEQVVTRERFARDVPSGVLQSPRNVLVCGVSGTTFESADAFLGETQEVWFIHNGFLFEATTLRLLKDFQERILSTCTESPAS